MKNNKSRSCWEPVKDIMGKHKVIFGQHLSYQFINTPRRILHMMSYYKFASKIIGKGKNVLDVGCGEGLGTWLLAAECGRAKGIDTDYEAIETGRKNWKDSKVSFDYVDFFAVDSNETYDAIVSFDVLEHILPENRFKFWNKVAELSDDNGIAVIGTPNITSDQYASPVTKAGHVNLYSGERLEEELGSIFSHVFMFGANDEVVHTGFLPMAHYLIAVAFHKRRL